VRRGEKTSKGVLASQLSSRTGRLFNIDAEGGETHQKERKKVDQTSGGGVTRGKRGGRISTSKVGLGQRGHKNLGQLGRAGGKITVMGEKKKKERK